MFRVGCLWTVLLNRSSERDMVQWLSFCSNYTPPVVISLWSVFCIIRYKARRLEIDLYRSAFRPDKGNINNFDVKETDWEI